jgi:hypothetical protein
MIFKKTTVDKTYVEDDSIMEFCEQHNGFFVRFDHYGENFIQIDKKEFNALLKLFKNKVVSDRGTYYVNKYIEAYWGSVKYGGTIQCHGLQTSIEGSTYKKLLRKFPKLKTK